MDSTPSTFRPRLLIEEWLPIAEIGEESIRERRSMTSLPPTYYLHVWWARRPLVASRAAVLASLLPDDADREMFMHILGIHGDPVLSRKKIDEAKRSGERFEGDAYSYQRAFKYSPLSTDINWILDQLNYIWNEDKKILLDPTSGGGSIPFESVRLGLHTIANELNPTACLILKATIEYPIKYGTKLLDRFRDLSKIFIARRDALLESFFPKELE